MESLLNNFFKNIKKNKYLYGLPLSLLTVVMLMTQGLEFTNMVKEDYTLRMVSYCFFILVYLIYVGGEFRK